MPDGFEGWITTEQQGYLFAKLLYKTKNDKMKKIRYVIIILLTLTILGLCNQQIFSYLGTCFDPSETIIFKLANKQ